MLMAARSSPIWHSLDTAIAAARLNVDASVGLTSVEAARRLIEHGPNVLVERGARSSLSIFASSSPP
jgi:Ca2+-transporting ATPase